jgi:hypothetical protein
MHATGPARNVRPLGSIPQRLLTRCGVGQVISVDMLPDDVLLVIFDFCADEGQITKKGIEAWQSLVHVCRRWRSVVFGSPRRLNLRLVCTVQPEHLRGTHWTSGQLYLFSFGAMATIRWKAWIT